MTVTVQPTSSMMESMLNANNVLTDVHNVLTVVLVKRVKPIEFFKQMDLAHVMKDFMNHVAQPMV